MSRFLLPQWKALSPYVPGEQPQERVIKLNTNESPYPPAPAIAALFARDAEETAEAMRLYPDPLYRELKETMRARFYPGPETAPSFFLGSGSDEVLATVFMAYTQGKKVYTPEITYGFYPVYADVNGADLVTVPMESDWSIDPRRFLGVDGTVLIANPNAPTGLALSLDAIEGIVRSNPEQVVVIDEAYVDFGAESAMSLVPKYDNLLVIQTLSKSRALAGLRFGFAAMHASLSDDLWRLQSSRNPYPVGRLTAKLAQLSLQDERHERECIDKIVRTRERIRAELLDRGFAVTASQTNFLFVQPPGKSAEAAVALKDRLRAGGILVRHFDTPLLASWLRITVGTDEEMNALMGTIDRGA